MPDTDTEQTLSEIKHMIASSSDESRQSTRALHEKVGAIAVDMATVKEGRLALQGQLKTHEEYDVQRFGTLWKVVIGSGLLTVASVAAAKMIGG